uniref:B30.2/SPRY domain-containing protein n=1 Tax=Tetraodon nigroviridis TaxID=99883 RepID=H3CR78_TETNG
MEELQEKGNQTDSLVDQVERLNGERQRLHDIIEELRENLSEKEERTIIAKSITMDPNTAHPRVALAEDNTELYTLAESRDVPDHPGRYDVVLATLGATGFSSGRRYWEVSVADRLCYHVGLAAASAQRKGILRFAPQNGYWTLILNKQGQLRALDRMPKVLPVQAPPGALGVLLDYRNGQVSFYDTGSRSHLYSFSGNSFTDELFPFINFCNEDIDSQTPIRLIPPGSTDWLQ